MCKEVVVTLVVIVSLCMTPSLLQMNTGANVILAPT